MNDEARIFWLIVGVALVGVAGYYSFPLRVYSFVLGGVFVIFTTVVLVKYHKAWPLIIEEKYRHLTEKKIEPKPEFKEQWQVIRKSMKSNDLNELRVGIIDADTLLEEFLRSQGIEGDTMAALIAEATFKSIAGTDALSRFHRLRNKIVHESTFTPSREDLRVSLQGVDTVLVKWGVILPLEA